MLGGEEGSVDLLSSGQQRPPEPTPRPWLARARRLWRRRGTRAAAVVLVAAAALVLLQVTVRPERRAADRAAGPAPTHLPGPPFDHRPGRTSIPAPLQTGDLLSGSLPFTGSPSRDAAGRAAGLVLGRYCADLSRYAFTVEPYADDRSIDFHHLHVVVVDRVLTDSGTDMRLSLEWEGSAYRWFGPLALVNGC
jgi:hypothetical protein